MAGVRINCPNCGRVLGDTEQSIDAVLNCNACKQHVHVRIKVTNFKDYLVNLKQEQNNDKSK